MFSHVTQLKLSRTELIGGIFRQVDRNGTVVRISLRVIKNTDSPPPTPAHMKSATSVRE